MVVFPNLLLLRWCDKSTPVIDVLYHIALRTSAALKQQREKLLQEDLFDLDADGDVKHEDEEVFGPDVDAPREGEESDTADNATDEMDVHRQFLWAWDDRKTKLQHEYAMAGFALSVTILKFGITLRSPTCLAPTCGKHSNLLFGSCIKTLIQTKPCG